MAYDQTVATLNAQRVFNDLAREFSHLSFVVSHDDRGVDINVDIPKQAGLRFAVNLNLQGDELHLSAASFWVEWFPCTEPEVVARYHEAARGLLAGEFRIVEDKIRDKPFRARLQRPKDGGWQTITTWANLGCLLPLRGKQSVYQNLP